jgi:hypothetical protein
VGISANQKGQSEWENKFLGHDQKSDSEPPTNPLVNINVDVKGIEKFAGVCNNLIKAFSRGIGSFFESNIRIRSAKADRAVAIERADTLIDLKKRGLS